MRIDSIPTYYSHSEYKNENFEEKEDIPTPSPNSKLKTTIKNLQTAIASGDKDQLVSSIAEGREIEEESNSSEQNRLLEQAEKKLGSADKKALQETMVRSIQDKLTKNSVTTDQLSSEAKAAQQELESSDNLESARINEISQMVNNNIGEVALTNLITKIKTFLASHSISSEQSQKFRQELTSFTNDDSVSYKKHAYQKNSSTVDQLLVQLAQQEQVNNPSTEKGFFRAEVLVPIALVGFLVILIIVVISSNRKRR